MLRRHPAVDPVDSELLARLKKAFFVEIECVKMAVWSDGADESVTQRGTSGSTFHDDGPRLQLQLRDNHADTGKSWMIEK